MKAYPIGYFHIDIAEVWTEEGKLYMFVAIDRVSKLAFAGLHECATRRVAADFLRRLIELVPYRIHTVLTATGTQMIERKEIFRAHSFDLACARNDIDHRLSKPNHPWTNGQVERMNRTIKEAIVRRYYYESHDRLQVHLARFLDAYNFARRLKSLGGLTPCEYIAKPGQNSHQGSG